MSIYRNFSAINSVVERITSICKLQFFLSIVPFVNRPQKIFVFAGSHLLNSKVVHIHNLSAVSPYPKILIAKQTTSN